MGVAASLAFNNQGVLEAPQSASSQPCRGSFPKPSERLQLHGRGQL